MSIKEFFDPKLPFLPYSGWLVGWGWGWIGGWSSHFVTQVAKLCPRRGVTATGLCPDWGFTATWGVSVGRVRDLHGQVLLKLFSAKNEIQEEEFQARQRRLESPNGQNLVIIGQMINTGVGDRFPNTSSNKKLILRMLKGLCD